MRTATLSHMIHFQRQFLPVWSFCWFLFSRNCYLHMAFILFKAAFEWIYRLKLVAVLMSFLKYFLHDLSLYQTYVARYSDNHYFFFSLSSIWNGLHMSLSVWFWLYAAYNLGMIMDLYKLQVSWKIVLIHKIFFRRYNVKLEDWQKSVLPIY